MTGKLSFELVSPERLLMSAKVDMVVVPGTEGAFGVLAGHAPLVSSIRPGIVDVYDEKDITRIFVRGGFAEVTSAGLTVLTEEAIDLATLDRAALDARISNAQEDVADAKDAAGRISAQAALDSALLIRDSL